MSAPETVPSPEKVRAAVFGIGETACFEEAVLTFRAARGAREDIPLRMHQAKQLNWSSSYQDATAPYSYRYFTEAYTSATDMASKSYGEARDSLNKMRLTPQELQYELAVVLSHLEYFK